MRIYYREMGRCWCCGQYRLLTADLCDECWPVRMCALSLPVLWTAL